MPKSYRVVPDGDGWKVMSGKSNTSNHRTVSTHRKKSAAKRKARQLADSGDRLVILLSNGKVQSNREVM